MKSDPYSVVDEGVINQARTSARLCIMTYHNRKDEQLLYDN